VNRPFFSCFVAASLWVPALASGQAQPASGTQANANLVVVDVVVTDGDRHPVHKLTASDFVVTENGKPQTIATIEEHNSWESAAPLPRAPKLARGTFTNFSIAPASGVINVLLLDLLNTPEDEQAAVRDAMVAYLKDVRPGARMAIFGLTRKLVMLQGLTSEPEQVSDILNGEQDLQKTLLAATDIVNAGIPDANDSATELNGAGMGNAPSAPEVIVGLRQFEMVTEQILPQDRAQATLDALNMLGHSLGKLPGRKNLIWISGAFPFNVLVDGGVRNSSGAVAGLGDEVRETADLLARSRVAVYPIEAHGVTGEAAVSSDAKNASDGGAETKGDAKPVRESGDSHETMQALALATGGESYTGADGINAAVGKAIDAGSHCYTISYTPADQRWNGDYRAIHIDAVQKGLTLAYRRGYFADDPNGLMRAGKLEGADKGQAPLSTMTAAMVRGGPDATDILFTATVQPIGSEPEPTVAPGNQVNELVNGPYRRYGVQFGIDLHDLACPANAEGVHQCKLEVAAHVYDVNGTQLNSAGGVIAADIPTDHYATVLRSGLRFRQEISVPVEGYSFLRIGVHEHANNKIGTVEFPVAAVSNLPALAAPPVPQGAPSAAK
jgi:VWFA-related protein